MKDFKQALYEAVLFSYGKILAKYNTFAQDSILKDVGREIIEYLNESGFPVPENGTPEDIEGIIAYFVENGFVDALKVEPAEKGHSFVWENLYGVEAYEKLQAFSDNPFLSCPLNACVYHVARKHNKQLVLHSKSFDPETHVCTSQEEIVDAEQVGTEGFDPLVIENARLFELAEKRAQELEAALNEVKQLKRLIPICSHCKKIRDDNGYWNLLEEYFHENAEIDFSHGICPDCAQKHYGELEWMQKRSDVST